MPDSKLQDEIGSLLDRADCLYELAQIEKSVAEMAQRITAELSDSNPILLPVMNGGLNLTAGLVKHFQFPLQMDYLHVTRYRESTSGGAVDWIYKPRMDLADRTVLIIDDLLDHGITLREASKFCRKAGALRVCTAVLVIKDIDNRPGLDAVDYHALRTPDRYLFGYGMDYKTYWRNAPGIYAI